MPSEDIGIEDPVTNLKFTLYEHFEDKVHVLSQGKTTMNGLFENEIEKG